MITLCVIRHLLLLFLASRPARQVCTTGSYSELTCVDLLKGDVLLELTPQFDLSAVLPRSAVVRQDEVGVEAVEDCQLAHRVGHGLVGAHHLGTRGDSDL